jgi:hypothetical protein
MDDVRETSRARPTVPDHAGARGDEAHWRAALTAAENERVVVAVLAERYRLPLDRVTPGETRVVELSDPSAKVHAYAYRDGLIAGANAEHLGLVEAELAGGPADARAAMARLAARLGGRPLAVVNRTGVAVPPPEAPVAVLDAADPRLPSWVLGHFSGEAWVVAGDDGRVLSTAVLKRYDERLREISVGTEEAARGRGLARAVVAAAARAVLAEGRAVLYNHELDNIASARVAESVGLHQLGILHAVVPDGFPRG